MYYDNHTHAQFSQPTKVLAMVLVLVSRDCLRRVCTDARM